MLTITFGYSRRTGITTNITDGSIVKQWVIQWTSITINSRNLVIIRFNIYTCTFPTMTCQNVCSEEGLFSNQYRATNIGTTLWHPTNNVLGLKVLMINERNPTEILGSIDLEVELHILLNYLLHVRKIMLIAQDVELMKITHPSRYPV